jgi:hypothetical protein
MNHFFRTTVLAALLLAGLSTAQAAVQNYSFSGSLNDVAFSGGFSFDDAALSEFDAVNSPLLTVAPLMNFSMNYGTFGYSLANAWAAPDVSYYDGVFLGLSLSNDAMTFVPGTLDKSDAFVTDGFKSADVIYAAVPEPESYAMLLAGLGLMGVLARRRRLSAAA